MMMMMFPWCRADSLSSQRGNSSKILLGSMDKPEIDQKCCSSYVTAQTERKRISTVILSVFTGIKSMNDTMRERPPYFDCEAFDNENWL